MSRTYRGHHKRDTKDWSKPNKLFKTMTKKIRRAKEKQALREGKQIPIFKKTDTWDWN